jgi:uncharacterized protein YecE (DUF72 family)
VTEYLIGTSGWHYEDWRGVFYPGDLPRKKWLEFYAQKFNTVEVNNSFYRLPSEAAFIEWRTTVPSHFIYAVKVSRFITHVKRLKNVEEPVANFLSRARLLEDKLGVLLYQLPPQMKRNYELLEVFLRSLKPGLRNVFEFRHESWFDDSIFELLHRFGAGFCVFDMPGVACPFVETSNFAYIRFHGSQGLYWSRYSEKELNRWARTIVDLGKDLKTIYIYFNNDAQGHAVINALQLRRLLTGK